ncbi:MAG: hypothetical protein M3276_07710 [Actinomycetota bacterium]|nr:hypothetical protein [Actinomycetota bacterium]
MTPKVAHRWTPITDLTAEDVAARSRELPPLAEVWKEQRQRLGDDRALETFNERLHREWAIETGVIERLYTLDRGITRLLIERGVDASLIPHDATDKPPELVAGIIRDQQSAVDWLFDVVAARRELSTSFIKELHALMARKQETATGLDPLGAKSR